LLPACLPIPGSIPPLACIIGSIQLSRLNAHAAVYYISSGGPSALIYIEIKMKVITTLFVILFGFLAQAQVKVNPIIKDYGAVYQLPNAAHHPDPKINYKILVELQENASKPDSLNEWLEAIATLINLHAAEGVPKEKIHVVVVLRKMATYAVFGNELYREKFKVDNPNLELIRELHDAGTEFYVCGQTITKRNIAWDKLVPEAKVASSGLTAITTFQMQGYTMVKF
jgi:intracellular sulfur oxidation DsrE/DsrF family protein